MTGPDPPDELVSGDGGPPRRTVPRVAWLLAAAVLAAAGVWGVFHGRGDNGPAAGPPPPTHRPAPRPVESSSGAGAGVDPGPLLVTTNADLCVATDHRRRIVVDFGVVNVSSRPLDVVAARADLPLGGLRQTSASVGKVACGDTAANGGSGHLAAGDSLTVRLTLHLPRECPKPYPVMAELLVRRAGHVAPSSEPVRLLNDLGPYDFDQC